MKLSLQDALSNWLSIYLVVEIHPTDEAAQETADWFQTVLSEDHQVTKLSYEIRDGLYHVFYTQNGEQQTKSYPPEYVEVILNQIEEHPEQFKQYQ